MNLGYGTRESPWRRTHVDGDDEALQRRVIRVGVVDLDLREHLLELGTRECGRGVADKRAY